MPPNAKDLQISGNEYLSEEKLSGINRKPNRLYLGEIPINSSSFSNMSHSQDTIRRANNQPSSKKYINFKMPWHFMFNSAPEIKFLNHVAFSPLLLVRLYTSYSHLYTYC